MKPDSAFYTDPRKDVFVYLSGPITAKDGFTVADNVESAVRVFLNCTRRGIPSFCPQLGALVPEAFEIDYEQWMAYDFAVIDRCTHVLMLPRWESSSGAVRERDYAQIAGLPVCYTLEELISTLEKAA